MEDDSLHYLDSDIYGGDKSPISKRGSFIRLYNTHINDVIRAADKIRPGLITRYQSQIADLDMYTVLRVFSMSDQKLSDYLNSYLSKDFEYYKTSRTNTEKFRQEILEKLAMFNEDSKFQSNIRGRLVDSNIEKLRMLRSIRSHQMNVFLGAILKFIHQNKSAEFSKKNGEVLRSFYKEYIEKQDRILRARGTNTLKYALTHDAVREILFWKTGSVDTRKTRLLPQEAHIGIRRTMPAQKEHQDIYIGTHRTVSDRPLRRSETR